MKGCLLIIFIIYFGNISFFPKEMETKVDTIYDHIKHYWNHILLENETHLICKMLNMRGKPRSFHTFAIFLRLLNIPFLKQHTPSVLYFLTHNRFRVFNILWLFQSSMVFPLIQKRVFFSI